MGPRSRIKKELWGSIWSWGGVYRLVSRSWGQGGRDPGLWAPWEASPSGLVVVPQPETVHLVPGASQWEGRLTLFTLDDILAGWLSFTSMMSLTWVCVE